MIQPPAKWPGAVVQRGKPQFPVSAMPLVLPLTSTDSVLPETVLIDVPLPVAIQVVDEAVLLPMVSSVRKRQASKLPAGTLILSTPTNVTRLVTVWSGAEPKLLWVLMV